MTGEPQGRLEISPALSLELSPDMTELRVHIHPPADSLDAGRARVLARWLNDVAELLDAESRRPRRPEEGRQDDAGGGGIDTPDFETPEQKVD